MTKCIYCERTATTTDALDLPACSHHSGEADEYVSSRVRRAPVLQSALDSLADEFDIPNSFLSASDHPYSCRCDACLAWWASMGPDPDDDGYGPFGAEEVAEYKRQHNDRT